MNQIENIAKIAHEANKVYCELIDDQTQTSWEDAPLWQRTSATEGVKKIISGEVKSPSEAHESWMTQKIEEGWSYGSTKDAEAKEHPCLVEYSGLPDNQKIKDYVFFCAVKSLVANYAGLYPDISAIKKLNIGINDTLVVTVKEHDVPDVAMEQISKRFQQIGIKPVIISNCGAVSYDVITNKTGEDNK